MVDDRDRGILTQGDREYLAGESDIEPKSQSERNARSRIRKRVRNGLLDFQYLANPELFDERDLTQVWQYEDESGKLVTLSSYHLDDGIAHEPVLDPEIEDALIELIAFTFRVKPDSEYFEAVIRSGVERALDRGFPEFELDEVAVSVTDPETVADRVDRHMERGIPLTDAEIRVAHEQQIRTDAEIGEYIREHGTRQEGVSSQGLDDPRGDIRERVRRMEEFSEPEREEPNSRDEGGDE